MKQVGYVHLAVFRSPLFKELLKDFPTIKTVFDLIENAMIKFPDRPALGTRYQTLKGWGPYHFKTYQQVCFSNSSCLKTAKILGVV